MANGIDIPGLLKRLETRFETGAATQAGREATGMGALQERAGLYGPGYLRGEEQAALAGMEQSMVGRGLSGTTRPGAVGAGIRARFRTERTRGRAGALSDVAQFAGSYRDPYAVGAGELTHLATGGFSGLLQQAGMNLAARQQQLAAEQQQYENIQARRESPYDSYGRLKPGFAGGVGGVGGGGISAGRGGALPTYGAFGGSLLSGGGGGGSAGRGGALPTYGAFTGSLSGGGGGYVPSAPNLIGEGGGSRRTGAQYDPNWRSKGIGGGSKVFSQYERPSDYGTWLQETGKGATARTSMQFERSKRV